MSEKINKSLSVPDCATEYPVNILIVDDSEENIVTLKYILGDLNYNLVSAKSGIDALKCLMVQDFAVVLLDVVMPTMDGFEAAKLIRSRERTKHLPIIFTTAMSTDEASVFSGYSVGAVDYILSPIVPEILRAKVSVFVDLYCKTEEIKRQAAELRHLERKQHEKELETERLRLSEQYLIRERELERSSHQKLEQQADLLSESNAELERFAHVVSHDLQEPLNTISSYCELLERGLSSKLDDISRTNLGFIKTGAIRMKALIKSLLVFSKMKRDDMETTTIDLTKVLDRTLSGLSTLIEENGAEVTYDDLPSIPGDEFRFSQVFQNLIANAIKFRGNERPIIRITSEKKGPHWVFCVADNGIGIEEKFFDQIFVMFKRIHPREKYEGTGMGLSLCKKIVENYAGRIWVESKVGRGSKFFFTIPDSESANKAQSA